MGKRRFKRGPLKPLPTIQEHLSKEDFDTLSDAFKHSLASVWPKMLAWLQANDEDAAEIAESIRAHPTRAPSSLLVPELQSKLFDWLAEAGMTLIQSQHVQPECSGWEFWRRICGDVPLAECGTAEHLGWYGNGVIELFLTSELGEAGGCLYCLVRPLGGETRIAKVLPPAGGFMGSPVMDTAVAYVGGRNTLTVVTLAQVADAALPVSEVFEQGVRSLEAVPVVPGVLHLEDHGVPEFLDDLYQTPAVVVGSTLVDGELRVEFASYRAGGVVQTTVVWPKEGSGPVVEVKPNGVLTALCEKSRGPHFSPQTPNTGAGSGVAVFVHEDGFTVAQPNGRVWRLGADAVPGFQGFSPWNSTVKVSTIFAELEGKLNFYLSLSHEDTELRTMWRLDPSGVKLMHSEEVEVYDPHDWDLYE